MNRCSEGLDASEAQAAKTDFERARTSGFHAKCACGPRKLYPTHAILFRASIRGVGRRVPLCFGPHGQPVASIVPRSPGVAAAMALSQLQVSFEIIRSIADGTLQAFFCFLDASAVCECHREIACRLCGKLVGTAEWPRPYYLAIFRRVRTVVCSSGIVVRSLLAPITSQDVQ